MSLRLFCADLKAASKSNSVFVNMKWFLLNHTLHLLFLFRLGQDLRRIPVFGKVFSFIVEYGIRVLYASDMSCKATIGEGFVVMHGHNIVIGADVVIGTGCKIFNGVTLGNRDISKSSYGNQPVLGDNVVLCTGAKILGNVALADNVLVAANSVVIKDCPENVMVAGIPAKIIREN